MVTDYPFTGHFLSLGGPRLHYLDEGEGQPIVLFHGEPTWSFLWRTVMRELLEKGFRCIAPDLTGFGRSDKPTDVRWYTYDRHVESVTSQVKACA